MSVIKNCCRSLFLVFFSVVLAACGLTVSNEDRIQRGEQAMIEGDFRTAIIESKAVLLEEPNNVTARLLLGRASAQSGDAATSESELRKAIELGVGIEAVAVDLGRSLIQLKEYTTLLNEIDLNLPLAEADINDVLLLRGQATLGLGRYEEARELFVSVLQNDNENIDAQIGIVSAYVEEGNLAQARETLQIVLDNHGEIIAPWLISADLAKMSRNFVRAEADLDRALELASAQSDNQGINRARLGLGDVFLLQNKTEATREILTVLESERPEAVETRELAARLAATESDWALAQENLQAILRQFPDHRHAQYMLGTVHMRSGNLAQAEMYLSAVVSADSTHVDARRNLAETRYRLDQSESARAALRPILEEPDADIRSLGTAAAASLAAGDFENAAEFLSRAAQSNPENLDSQLDLAVAYLMADRIEEAEAIFESVDDNASDSNRLRRDVLQIFSMTRSEANEDALNKARELAGQRPENVMVMSLLGALELSNGNVPAARASFEAASVVAPEAVTPMRYLAAVDENEGLFDAAMARHQTILSANPGDSDSLLAMARLTWADEDYPASRTWLEKIIDADAENDNARQLLGRSYLAVNDFAAAKNAASDAIIASPDNPFHYAIQGYAQKNLGEIADAIVSFERAAELAPENPQFRVEVASARMAQGDKEQSVAVLEEAHNEMPEALSVGIMLASIRIENGDLDGAKSIVEDLQTKHKDSPLPILLQSEILVREGDLQAAADLYDVALDMDSQPQFAVRAYQIRNSAGLADKTGSLTRYLEKRPLDHEIRVFLGQIYQQDGQNAQAIGELERVLDITPDNYVAANNLAWIYFLEDDSRAEEVARSAYNLAPDNDSIVDTLGWIMVKKGKVQEGVTLLREAVSKSGGRIGIRYHLAAGLAELGESEEASKILAEILESDSQFSNRQDAEQLLQQL